MEKSGKICAGLGVRYKPWPMELRVSSWDHILTGETRAQRCNFIRNSVQRLYASISASIWSHEVRKARNPTQTHVMAGA